mgnify:CR=1 FL=1
MSGLKITQEIEAFEVNGMELTETLQVNSHREDNSWVVLVVGGKELTVCGRDLQRAAENAMNWELE